MSTRTYPVLPWLQGPPQTGHVAQGCQLQHPQGPAVPPRKAACPHNLTTGRQRTDSYLLRVKPINPEGALTDFISLLSHPMEVTRGQAALQLLPRADLRRPIHGSGATEVTPDVLGVGRTAPPHSLEEAALETIPSLSLILHSSTSLLIIGAKNMKQNGCSKEHSMTCRERLFTLPQAQSFAIFLKRMFSETITGSSKIIKLMGHPCHIKPKFPVRRLLVGM